MNFIFVLVAMAIVDFFYGKYTIAAAGRKAVAASFWAAGIMSMSGFVIIEYTKDHVLIIAAVIGSMVGTYFSVKAKKGE